MTLPVLIPAAATDPIFGVGFLVLGFLAFATIVAWVTRATGVAILAMGLCVVMGGLLGLWTSYLSDKAGPLEMQEVVWLRFLAASFFAAFVIDGIVAKYCWKSERTRWIARNRSFASDRLAPIGYYDRAWMLSLLQKKVGHSPEKVSTSARSLEGASSAESNPEDKNP